MSGFGIDFEPWFHESVSQLVPSQHPQHGLAQYFDRIPFQHAFGGSFFQTPRISRVPPIQFLPPLISCEMNLIRIDHNDRIAHVLVGQKGGLVFASQDGSNLNRQPTDRLVLRID